MTRLPSRRSLCFDRSMEVAPCRRDLRCAGLPARQPRYPMSCRRSLIVVAAVVLGCSPGQRPEAGAPSTGGPVASSPIARTGIDGCNCAGAAPAMLAPDGHSYPFQSVVAYYYQVLQAFWTKIANQD